MVSAWRTWFEGQRTLWSRRCIFRFPFLLVEVGLILLGNCFEGSSVYFRPSAIYVFQGNCSQKSDMTAIQIILPPPSYDHSLSCVAVVGLLRDAVYIDEARQLKAKQEQEENIVLLESTGSRQFDLPTDWLPDGKFYSEDGPCEDDDNDYDDVGDENTNESDCDHDSSDEEDDLDWFDGRQQGATRKRPSEAKAGKSRGLHDVAVGSFAFFVATEAPFLVGKVEGEREGDGGDRDVLHWYTPSKSLLERAATVEFDVYGKAVFNAAYNVEEVPAGAGRIRTRKIHVKDTSWEPASRVTASCRKLNGKGKRIPATVLKTLKDASHHGRAAS